MSDTKQIICPNCGANITNTQNCEYCGSLLVRFVDKGIDMSKTNYLNDTKTYPGLINALKLNLQLQKSTEEPVATDIVGPVTNNERDFIGSILRSGYISYKDGSPVPSESKNGISIVFSFPLFLGKLEKEFEQYNVDIEYEHERFKTLDCFPIFMEHISFYTDSDGNKMKEYQYFIDFGEDAEGAARLITKVWKEVYKIHFDANIEYYTNAGSDNISKCRNEINQELCDVEYNDDSESSQYWYYLILVIVGLLVFFITTYS